MNSKLLAAFAALIVFSPPALAQKSKDTLRYPMQENEPTFERYTSPGAYHYVWSNAVWDDLLAFDPTTGKFLPALAKSYSQPSDTVYEYELREDVKWHDGQPFTADDVVYTLSWLTDPKTQLRYKANWDWIASVEKLGPYKVRVTAKRPVPDGLMWMASGWAIYPKHLHEPLADKSAFGDKPVGTGPYKINKVEKVAGIVAENYKDFRPTSLKPKGSFGHIVSEPIHDTGTLVAALITGRADLVADLPPDQAADLVKSGKFEVSLAPKAVGYTFLTFPSSGWKNKKMLADPKVRLALAKAIDRKALVKLKYGEWAGNMQPVEGMCDKAQLGCGYTKLYPDYDPEGAKKLLAEAGYPEGFDVGIAAFQKYVPEAVAISGMFRSIGVKANVTPISITQRVSLLNQGRVEIGLFGWSGGASFEVSPQIVRHFLSNDYDDQPMNVEASKTLPIIDDAERRKAVGKVFDQITEKAYAFPMTPSPEIYTHTKEVKLLAPPDLIHPAQTVPVHKFGWK
jgi:peptide/nickel transport system substrate-binding protein